MVMIDAIRTLMRIRRTRQLLPAGPQPAMGSSIVNGRKRMRLKYAVTGEQWHWLSQKGWRTVDMRQNRRHYELVDDQQVLQLLSAETTAERSEIHAAIMSDLYESEPA